MICHPPGPFATASAQRARPEPIVQEPARSIRRSNEWNCRSSFTAWRRQHSIFPYVLESEVSLTEAGELGLEQEVICLVVMKCLNGLLLALPLNTAASEVLQLQTAAPREFLAPSAVVEVAAVARDLLEA